jgi:hypothetical protein
MSEPSKREESASSFSQAKWQPLIDSGSKLLCLLDASIEEADRLMGFSTQSTWLGAEDPANYGWVLEPHVDDGLALDSLQHAFEDLGLSEEQGNWQQVWAWHNKDWMQDGEMRQVCGFLRYRWLAGNGTGDSKLHLRRVSDVEQHTCAKYFATYSVIERENAGLIAKVMYGPRYMIEEAEREEGERGRRGPPIERGANVVPRLERWSDLTFLVITSHPAFIPTCCS